MQHPFENVPLLLATGQGRSGTTVLTKALGEHPQIYSNLVESNVMKDVFLAGRASSTMPSRVKQMVLPRVKHDAIFRIMLLNLLFPVDGWPQVDTPGYLSTFSAMEPEAAEFAVRAFPKIHFANIVRHGVEVVASRMVHRALGQHSFEEHCLAWAVSREMAEWGEDRNDFSLIRHETLLQEHDCRRTFEDLFEKIGLDESDSAVNYVMNKKFNQTSYDQEMEVGSSDLAKRKDRWNHWTADQQAIFRDLCGPTMDYFGYEFA